jgi:hypothetical protein
MSTDRAYPRTPFVGYCPVCAATSACMTTMSSLTRELRGVEPAHGGQLVPASLASADPGGVAVVGDGSSGPVGDQVDRVVEQVDQPQPFLLARGVGVPEDQRDVDLRRAQHAQRLDRVDVDSDLCGQQLQPREVVAHRRLGVVR